MYDVRMFIRYLVSITQILKDTKFGFDNGVSVENLLLLFIT
jgi:hypothetical protein